MMKMYFLLMGYVKRSLLSNNFTSLKKKIHIETKNKNHVKNKVKTPYFHRN